MARLRSSALRASKARRWTVRELVWILNGILFGLSIIVLSLSRRGCTGSVGDLEVSGRQREDGWWEGKGEESRKRFVFVFSTGRTGTKHFSSVFGGGRSYVNHQDEAEDTSTKDVVEQVYRRFAATGDVHFAKRFLEAVKIPMMKQRMKDVGDAQVYFQTGHVPLAFGFGEALLSAFGSDAFAVVRVRRDRISSALSLMALGPEAEDPWEIPKGTSARQSRWFPRPSDHHVKLQVSSNAWRKMNRFQRYLWLVDDTECRWQAFKKQYIFDYLEVQMEALSQMDNGEQYRKIANFVGTECVEDQTVLHARDNSIEQKKRDHVKWIADERTLRLWDNEYRLLVGPCHLTPTDSFTWS